MQEYIASRFNNFVLHKVIETNDSYEFHLINQIHTASCTSCGVESKYIHQQFNKVISDLSYNGKAVNLFFIQRKLKCKNPFCPLDVFVESLSFIDGKKPYSIYVVNEIMKNREKTVRTISAIMDEVHKVKISKSSISRIINDYSDDYRYQEIMVLKLDKEQLEKNVDDSIDAVAEIAYSPADYILEEVERSYNVVDNITACFKDASDYQTTYPYSLFIMAGLVSRVKRLVATSSMPFAFTNSSVINKIGFNLLKKRADGTYFSSGAFRDYLLNSQESKIEECFNKFSYSILSDNKIKPTVHIMDATKIEVNMYNGNYENASVVSDDEGIRTKGYKLTALYGLYEEQLVHECSKVTTLKTHDLVAGKMMLTHFAGLKKGDYLLADRGYASFDFFHELKERGIYIVTPAKKDYEVYRDALSLAGVRINDAVKKGAQTRRIEDNPLQRDVKWRIHPNKKRKDQEYTTIRDIKIYNKQTDSRICKTLDISCAVIRFPRKTNNLLEEGDIKSSYYEDEKYCYAVIYTTDTSLEGSQIISLYEKRMKIEDQFKQLKQNWDLCKLTSTKYKFIMFQLLSTITAMGLVQLFTTLESGSEFKNCYLQTIVMKLDCIEKYNKVDVIVASKDVFAVYKLSGIFEVFMNKDKKVQQELIKHLRLFEAGNG